MVFLNAFGSQAPDPEKIVDAAVAEDADVIVFAESGGVLPVLGRLPPDYGWVSPCAAETCEVLMIAKSRPIRFWRLSLNAAWPDRYAVAEFEAAAGQRFFLAGVHMVKPWFSGIAESEQAKLAAQFNWFDLPAVTVGDFNAAPWSLPFQRLLRATDMHSVPLSPATWPAAFGALGVPIDHALVHGGARVVGLRPFGGALGSNHRGLIVDISLP